MEIVDTVRRRRTTNIERHIFQRYYSANGRHSNKSCTDGYANRQQQANDDSW